MHARLSVMMLVYRILQWYGMLVCYVVVCYCMLVWYDVSVIGYCRVCYCMLEWYDVSIIGYCRVCYGIYYTSIHDIVL